MKLVATVIITTTREIEFDVPDLQQVAAEEFCRAAVRKQFGDCDRIFIQQLDYVTPPASVEAAARAA